MHGQRVNLEAWTSFCTTTATASATLLGLMFVVITLAAERRPSERHKIKIYLTPVVVCFGSVLLLGGIVTIPNHTWLSLGLLIGLEGLAGLAYGASLAFGRQRGDEKYEFRSHVVPFVLIPSTAYILMLMGSLTALFQGTILSLNFSAAAVLILLGIGTRNSWATAVAIAST